MWELIAYNKRQSYLLIAVLAVILFAMGALIGSVIVPPREGAIVSVGALIGVAVAFGIWSTMTTSAWFAGDKFVLATSAAKRIEHRDYPQLFNVVEEMSIAAGVPMPKVYLINDSAPNAFATGRKPETASIAVTTGLAEKLTRDELQGVVAHEMGHIRNRDILFMTLAGVLVGTIVLLCDFFLRFMWFTGGSSRRSSSRRGGKGGGAQIIIMVLAILLAILAPIFARLLYFAISRRREYLADATAVELTRYPPGLASALEKIVGDQEVLEVANRATAHLYIVNPIKPHEERYRKFTSTHPPIRERVAILRSIASGGSVGDYERARQAIGAGPKRTLVSQKTVREAKPVELRKGVFQPPKPDRPGPKKMTPQMLWEKLAPLHPVLLASLMRCGCGAELAMPADPATRMLLCAACGREHDVQAMLAQAQAELEKAGKAPPDVKTLDDLDPATSGEAYDLEKAAAAAEQYGRPGGPGAKGPVNPSRLKPAGSISEARPKASDTGSYDPTGDHGLAKRFDDGAPEAKPSGEPPREGNPFGITFEPDGDPVYPEKVTCPHCSKELPVPKGFKGSRGPCPKCRKMIVFFER